MARDNKTANQNTAKHNTGAKTGRKSWGLPYADEPPIITPKELATVRKILGTGSIPEAFNILDRPVSDGSKQTLVGFFKGETDTETEYTNAELAAMIKEVLADLERAYPRHGKVLRRRMRGETLEEIGADLKVTRERIRQMEVKAKRILRDDIRMRTLAENIGITVRIDETVEYLQLFGFSNIFIERWGKRGFPSFEKLNVAAVLIAEIAYPQCLKAEECENGTDMLDKEKFARLTANINLRIINELCATNDFEKLVDALGEYLKKCLVTEQTETQRESVTENTGHVDAENLLL